MSNALLRFWWVVVLGCVVGVGLAVWMVYEIPGFTPRDRTLWTAQARIFVTSSQGQYVRLSVPRSVEPTTTAASQGQDATDRAGGGPVVFSETPNVQPLLAAANLYPLLIESDDVAKLREELYGPLPGTVYATAYSAVSTPSRFTPAQLPVIDIFATSGLPDQAIALAGATADTFKAWIRKEQDRARVAPKERIIIRELVAPSRTVPSGGPSYGIPVLVTMAIIAAFGTLAVVLDQLIPRGVGAPQPRWLSRRT